MNTGFTLDRKTAFLKGFLVPAALWGAAASALRLSESW